MPDDADVFRPAAPKADAGPAAAPERATGGTSGAGEPAGRTVTCGTCGEEFGCRPAAGCWCGQLPVRLPMPTDGADCLCPRCLRAAADRR